MTIEDPETLGRGICPECGEPLLAANVRELNAPARSERCPNAECGTATVFVEDSDDDDEPMYFVVYHRGDGTAWNLVSEPFSDRALASMWAKRKHRAGEIASEYAITELK